MPNAYKLHFVAFIRALLALRSHAASLPLSRRWAANPQITAALSIGNSLKRNNSMLPAAKISTTAHNCSRIQDNVMPTPISNSKHRPVLQPPFFGINQQQMRLRGQWRQSPSALNNPAIPIFASSYRDRSSEKPARGSSNHVAIMARSF